MKDQRIVCAAMKMDDGLIITGIRHYSPEMRAILRRLYPQRVAWKAWLLGDPNPPYHVRVNEQGFVDQYGMFLSREEAWKIAEAAGQIRNRVSSPGILYSENLY